MKRNLLLLNILPALLLAAPPLPAQSPPLLPPRAQQPPVIDGRLDDPCWSSALRLADFKTYAPAYGQPMSEATEALVTYDHDHLYFAFRCFDREPGRILATVAQRDNMFADDWVAVHLDTEGHRQSFYSFYVNPRGVQADSSYANDVEDLNYDMVWQSQGTIDDRGYVVEIAVPLRSIRFHGGARVAMGILFDRQISRRGELGTAPAVDPGRGQSWLNQLQAIQFADLRSRPPVELLPAVTYSARRDPDPAGSGWISIRRPEAGLTAKLGLASDLILDGTVNPDFSQVEADVGQVDVNLRYSLYYPEKRPFFLEGSEHFSLAASFATEVDPFRYAVNTRAIVDPQLGFKLTGKAGERFTLAALYALDRAPEDGRDFHCSVLRAKTAVGGDGFLGMLLLGRSGRDDSRWLGGFDGRLRVGAGALLSFHALGSSRLVSDQREWGRAWGVLYDRETRGLDIAVHSQEISAGFDDPLGYLTRTGILQASALLRPKFYPTSGCKRLDWELFSAQTRDSGSRMWETLEHTAVTAYWGALSAKVKASYSTEIFNGRRFLTGGLHGLVAGRLCRQVQVSLLVRRIYSILYTDDPCQGRSWKVSGTLLVNPNEKLSGEFDWIYSDFVRSRDHARLYSYPIYHGKLVYQFNRYLFLRAIAEYNQYWRRLTLDGLISFTYIPGTVLYVGYGSALERSPLEDDRVTYGPWQEQQRAFFCKASFLWRL